MEGVDVVHWFGSVCGPAVNGIGFEGSNHAFHAFLVKDGGNPKEVVSLELDKFGATAFNQPTSS